MSDLKVKIRKSGEKWVIDFDKEALMKMTFRELLDAVHQSTENNKHCAPGECEFGGSGQCLKCGCHRPPVTR